ncbi:hypothetical protein I7I48_07062 [Histoplasma ohiense]|nr:hypothetical protein I7I48_07062 [Histoplasma ohiense (nom. inval.)]
MTLMIPIVFILFSFIFCFWHSFCLYCEIGFSTIHKIILNPTLILPLPHCWFNWGGVVDIRIQNTIAYTYYMRSSY